jgi:hypothetical protein
MVASASMNSSFFQDEVDDSDRQSDCERIFIKQNNQVGTR